MTTRRHAATVRRPIDPLEVRRLLAITATLSGGVLTVTGTLDNDRVSVDAYDGAHALTLALAVDGVDQASQSFTGVNSIVINLGDGNDSVDLELPASGHAQDTPLLLPTTITGGAGNDTIGAGSLADSVDGGDGDDYLFGSAGNDTLRGGAGNDFFLSDAGNDTIDGGSGNDEISYEQQTLPVSASLLGDLSGPGGTFRLSGSGGASGEADHYLDIETLTGGSGNDSLGFGTLSDDNTPSGLQIHLNGGGGQDHLSANTSDGAIPSTRTHVVADGGEGNDTLDVNLGAATNITLTGGAGDDFFGNNDDGMATIDAGDGFDTFDLDALTAYFNYTMPAGLERLRTGGSALLKIVGNDGPNTIQINNGSGTFDGAGGNDTITVTFPASGGSRILGGSGNDTITGSTADDSIDAGTGDDVVHGGNGNDSIHGGDGDDTLSGDDGRDTIRGDAGDDRIYGNGGSDHLYGNDGRDRLSGSGGNDVLDGGGGIDSLYGGDGNDRASRDKRDRIVSEIESLA